MAIPCTALLESRHHAKGRDRSPALLASEYQPFPPNLY